MGYLWGAIAGLAIFGLGSLATASYWAGITTQRVSALEQWRQEFMTRFERFQLQVHDDLRDGFNKIDHLIRNGEDDK